MKSDSFQGRRVLVTGGAGFLGSNLVLRLVSAGAQVTVLDSMVPELGGNAFNLSPLSAGSIRQEHADLRDRSALLRIVRGFDLIFNLAGNISHQDSMANPSLDLELNVTGHVNLLEVCRLQNREAVVVFSSTRQIYGVPQYLPVTESHPIYPTDVNGINKYAAEQYHLLYHRVHGLKTACLRLTNSYGPRQLIRHSRQGFVGWFLNRAMTGNPIQLYGGGQQRRDFNYVDDVCDALLTAAVSDACLGQALNLSGEIASLEQVAQHLIDCSGRGTLVKIPFPVEQKKIDIGDYFGNSDRFQEATGWRPRVGLAAGLKKMVEYYREFLPHYLSESGA